MSLGAWVKAAVGTSAYNPFQTSETFALDTSLWNKTAITYFFLNLHLHVLKYLYLPCAQIIQEARKPGVSAILL